MHTNGLTTAEPLQARVVRVVHEVVLEHNSIHSSNWVMGVLYIRMGSTLVNPGGYRAQSSSH